MKFPLNIESVIPIKHTHPNDINTDAIRFRFNDIVSKNSINKLINELPENYSISFFDPEIPQWSDPGAYFRVLKLEQSLFIHAGNHGWMTKYRLESDEVLTELVWACRNYNNDESNHFSIEKNLYSVSTCKSFGKGFEDIYLERINRLGS